MKCFYYKWINKKNGNVILANFAWAESFASIKSKNETRVISCVQIDEKEFREIRNKGL